MIYFIRANADTVHNNPNCKDWYVPGELPMFPEVRVNGLKYCFEHNIIRIGWPAVGDLRLKESKSELENCYTRESIKPLHRGYLEKFIEIKLGSIILVPDKDKPGNIYIAEITGSYDYFYDPPTHPFEHAHRFGVRWDRDEVGNPIRYHAKQLGIGIHGGFWLRAFAVINRLSIINEIRAVRQGR
jgi:hypothetical protein